jgi:two-component system, cell cycle response regulator DivK
MNVDAGKASLKLLIVEDDLPSLELMTEVFSGWKAQVRPISDSWSAVKIVNQEKFDGIFLDLEMPELHGFDLAQKVRKSSWNESTPIVIVTGRDDRHTMQEAFAKGATFFLQKPVDRQKLSVLFRTVRGSFLENRRRSARVPMQTEILCKTGQRAIRGRSWNLSQGGMQLELEDLKPGEAVRVSFRLPSSTTTIEAAGVVAWAKNDRQGVRFVHMSSQNQEAIGEFIAQAETSQ